MDLHFTHNMTIISSYNLQDVRVKAVEARQKLNEAFRDHCWNCFAWIGHHENDDNDDEDVGGGAGDDGVVEEQDDDNDDGGDDNYNDDDDLTSLGKNTPTVAVVTLKFFKVANMIAMKTHLRVPCWYSLFHNNNNNNKLTSSLAGTWNSSSPPFSCSSSQRLREQLQLIPEMATLKLCTTW